MIHGARGALYGGRPDEATSDARVEQLQLKMFNEHMELESQPGPDVAFGKPDDSQDVYGQGGQSVTHATLAVRTFALGRSVLLMCCFRWPSGDGTAREPLGGWFDAKEKGIQKLTESLEKVCDEMKKLNADAAQHLAQGKWCEASDYFA
jgi:hypothetical protein